MSELKSKKGQPAQAAFSSYLIKLYYGQRRLHSEFIFFELLKE